MFPSHLDGGSHIVSQNHKLRWPSVVMGGKLTMYTLATAGAKITRKAGESKKRKIQPQEVEEDFIPVASIRSVGLKRSKSTS
jgi:hypothetical protein